MCHIIGRPIAEQKLSLSFSREKTSSLLKSKPSNVLVGGVCLYIRKNTTPNTAFASLSSICNTIMGYLVVHLPLQNGLNGSCPKNELERPKHLFVRVEKFNEPCKALAINLNFDALTLIPFSGELLGYYSIY